MHKKGISLHSFEKFLSHSADRLRRRTFLCFERILVSNFFKQRKKEASRFCRIFFCLTRAKKLRLGTILRFRKFLLGKKYLWMRGGGMVSRFSVEKLLSHSTERTSFVKETFCFPESFGYRKNLCARGKYHDFRLKNCCLTVPTNFVGKPFCVSQNFWCRKLFWIRGGGGRELVSRFSS